VPSREIVIGAHRDAVPFSPGADDNASGTCAVLEIARVLNNIDTRLTIKFVLFDAEEVGLCGSKHYAADAASRGDQIVIMLNMDMIASIGSMDQAMVLPFPFGTNPYGQLWGTLADSLEDISIAANVTEPYGPKGSDHFFFYIYGYDAMEISEGSLSPVYHSPNDSIEYMDLDYYTRMTKASLATAFVAAATYWAEPTLVFEHPLDDPPLIYPGLDTQMVVALSTYSGEEIVPFSGQLHYSVDDGPFVSIPLNDLGSADFGATIPGQSCHSVVKYYFSAEGVQSGVAYHPDTASPIIKNVVTEIDVAFHDNFQFDLGWTVVGDATFGMWERAFPDGGVGAPEGDYDSSGYYNLPDRSMCYLTEQDGLYDVDHGVTNLYSPIIDLTYERAEVEYAIWFSNSSEANPYSDDFRVHVSPNGGQSWALLQQLGPVENADGGWELYRFQLDEIMPMPASVQFVFHAEDLGADSRVEAAVDAFRITQSTCDPRIITEQLSNGIVNEPYSQTLSAAGGDGVFTWSDLFDDLSGTGITLSAQGMLSGTPGDAGTFSFTAHAEDQAGDFHERAFDIWVSPLFICGDIDGSGGDPDIGDLVYLVDYMFAGGPPPPVVAAADVDGSGAIDIADLVYMVDFMFGGGPPPVCE
ncbi:MAG: M20/M25/M40 family metallo-hydrolase, partial [candidate division Zixibacteria bacterium]|nr:M20/M25/M40 family metallo-hydrolase [candidate division Zixibacteria bacterium]